MVSNFDTRLRRIMSDLGIDNLFDAVVISAEVWSSRSLSSFSCLIHLSLGMQLWGCLLELCS